MSKNKLPPRGQPTGGFRDYEDCNGGMSVMCLRPDCRRCHRLSHQQTVRWYEDLLAVIEYLRASRDIAPSAQGVVNHFDGTINACAKGIDQGRVKSLAAKFSAQDAARGDAAGERP